MNKRYIYSAIIGVAFLTACSDEMISLDGDGNGDMINFVASVSDSQTIKTRFPSDEHAEYVRHNDFDCNFYMEMDTEVDGLSVTEYGTYEVPSTYEGRLDAIDGSTPLNWKSLRGDHYFCGWTFPTGGKQAYNPANPFAGLSGDSFENAMAEGVEIKFKNSPEGEDYKNFNNNELYEKFIGTKKGPVSYVKDGTYVPLTFRHLVSKIFVDEIILDYYGVPQEHLKANMTIYGLPTSAIFYPNPEKANNFNPDDDFNGGWPVVVPKPDPSGNDEMTFYIENAAEHEDYIWICPEVDFSQLSFKVSLLSKEANYADMKDFNGTFENVVFERTGENWDNMNENGNWKGDDSTILHAGEMMVLKIILYPGGSGGLYIQILPWATHAPHDSPHYSHPGIYSDNALNELAGIADKDTESSTIENLFSLYGETEMVDGKEEKVFNLYENANLTFTNSSKQSELRVRNQYILEGNGHLITCTNSTVKVRNVRNVFITDGKGNYVYIDSEGRIFKVDGSTLEIGEKIGDMTANTSSIINLATGKVS